MTGFLIPGRRIAGLATAVIAVVLLACSASNATGSTASTRRSQSVPVSVPAGQAPAPASGGPVTAQAPISGLPVIVFMPGSGAAVPMSVEVADSEQSREYGLMYRTSMPDDHGMIFMFTRDVDVAFWMKDTLIDLSVAFVDSGGTIVDIQEMQAETLDNHFPAKSYQFAIEANATWYARHGIAVGDRVDLGQAVAKSSLLGDGSAPPIATATP